MAGIKLLKLSVTNCFLVEAEDSHVLVDIGYAFEWDLLCKRLRKYGVNLSQISHLILTHHHNDHSGSVKNIVQKNSSTRVVTSHLAKDPLLQGENNIAYRSSWFINKQISRAALLGIGPLISLRLRKVVPLPEVLITFPSYRLRNYDTMVVGDTGLRDVGVPLDGQIIATPGHAANSVSLLFDDGVCLLGDAAENEFAFQRLGADYRTHLITDVGALYASWEKLITAGARRMYPAHGCPFAVDKLKENLWKHTAENLVPVPSWVYRLS